MQLPTMPGDMDVNLHHDPHSAGACSLHESSLSSLLYKSFSRICSRSSKASDCERVSIGRGVLTGASAHTGIAAQSGQRAEGSGLTSFQLSAMYVDESVAMDAGPEVGAAAAAAVVESCEAAGGYSGVELHMAHLEDVYASDEERRDAAVQHADLSVSDARRAKLRTLLKVHFAHQMLHDAALIIGSAAPRSPAVGLAQAAWAWNVLLG